MTTEPASRWPVPPPAGWTVDDLFTLPNLPPHTQLIDGSLVFVSPQRRSHGNVIDLLVCGLRTSLPAEFKVSREMTVILDKHNGPEPDVSVVRTDAITGPDQMSYQVRDVLLVVEVVTPESASRDHTTKPRKYAAAGIENFWRVEESGTSGKPVVHVYELDPVTEAYVHAGIHRDRIKVDRPYAIDIDLTAVDEL
ncbi:Uma2 family endonuclease [Streptomyces sp. GS7]|uniref:Uma2 family endonuclease n=1 Tax=Streptomyces sp. GS7 TaxID=2692234 RepID=UPI001F24F5F2|nr:Uma2 family endonuclease [Streptomyces sp. GS7]